MTRATLVRVGGMAAIVGGVLRVAASFAPNVGSDVERQLLYLAIDVFLLLGVLGFYELRHEDIGRAGAVGFLLALVGLSVVRSSRAIPGVDLYPVGALAFAVGLLVSCVSAWKVKTLAIWVPVALFGSVLAGLVGTVVQGGGWVFVLSGVAFGVGFAGLGYEVRSAARRL
jgi:hypothetical protein